MRSRLTNILGLILVGIAIALVLSRGKPDPDAPKGGSKTANPRSLVPDRAGQGSSKLPRSPERKSSEELIRQAELLRGEGRYEAAFEVGMIAVERAPEGWASLPFQLRNFLGVMDGEPKYAGRILTAKDPSQGRFLMSTEMSPPRIVRSRSLMTGSEVGEPYDAGGDQGPLTVRYSAQNMGDFKEGDVVRVWAGALMLSNPPQVHALRIEKVK